MRKLEERQAAERRRHREQHRKHWWRIAAVLAISLGVGWLMFQRVSRSASAPPEEILARTGLHWHAKLKIVIKGKEEPIPAGIGLGPVHNPVHTHDPDSTIHLEFPRRVVKNDILLKQFFRVWGKPFTSTCIFDFCNGAEGTVRMLVNGRENAEFENYAMRDNDEIEIRYE